MSLTPPKQQFPSSPYLTSTVPFNVLQTPVYRHEPHHKYQTLSPEPYFHNVGAYEDAFGIYSNMESFQLSPGKEITTPVHQIQLPRPRGNLALMFQKGENHFEMTPKNRPQFSTAREGGAAQYKLDFSPYMRTADKQYHIEESVSRKICGQIKLQPNLKVEFKQFPEEEDEEEEEMVEKRPRSKKNCSKGLRNLSVTVAQIVKECQKVTYKEVASKLIVRFIEEGKIPPKHNNQDIQNAKRRVYDALNVLIAANVLTKQGKFVIPCTKKPKEHPACVQLNMIEKLKAQITMRKRNLEHRNQKLSQLYNKYAAAINLQSRNKQAKQVEKIIRFPFVFIKYPVEAQLKVSALSQAQIQLKLDKPFQMWGDIDMAIRLNLHKRGGKGLLSDEVVEYLRGLSKG